MVIPRNAPLTDSGLDRESCCRVGVAIVVLTEAICCHVWLTDTFLHRESGGHFLTTTALPDVATPWIVPITARALVVWYWPQMLLTTVGLNAGSSSFLSMAPFGLFVGRHWYPVAETVLLNLAIPVSLITTGFSVQSCLLAAADTLVLKMATRWTSLTVVCPVVRRSRRPTAITALQDATSITAFGCKMESLTA